MSPKQKIILRYLIDAAIYMSSLTVVFFLREGSVSFSELNHPFFFFYMFSWGASTILSRKIKNHKHDDFISALKPCLVAYFLMLGLLSLGSSILDYKGITRFIISGSMLVAFIIELVWMLYQYQLDTSFKKFKIIKSKKVFMLDFIILLWVFNIVIITKIGFKNVGDNTLLLLGGLLIIWFISGVTNHQFRFDFSRNYWSFIRKYVDSYLVTIALTSFLIFILKIQDETKGLIFQTLILYTFWSFVIVSYYFIARIPRKTDEIRISFLKANELPDELIDIKEVQKNSKYHYGNTIRNGQALKDKLKSVYLLKYPQIFESIDKYLALETLDINNSITIRSADPYNVNILPDNCIEFLMNLHEINDIRRINAYLIDINKKLKINGVFIGKFEPIKNRYKRYLTKYPFLIGLLFYSADFLWKRVTPKIPFIQKFYFVITKGKSRPISMAEGLGRLYFCGFEVKNIFEIDNFVYFIAAKIKAPLTDKTPSYGPFFKMRRIGKDGNEIFVYKVRTMHPYSEYLQKFVYDMSALQEGGKLKNDFRITTWGKIFRKLWIDELPMLINFFRGELKIVGVRPLSKHYLSLYNAQLCELRKKVKPGLVPPFYHDMPKTLEEIQNSELNYINLYLKSPVKTDFIYFTKAFKNIVFNKARSG
ncbi:MAG: hypothetical protein CVV23_08580 [Ignavibacteriae bacterium HGW-Ignavibacteriae-2]|nr:MAG: hypothetical protein CVV23_08580 [Ignavibacteriae bacterium HGW-Ignavibacteriae-2]